MLTRLGLEARTSESKACFCHYVLRTSQLTPVLHFLVCKIGIKIFPGLTPKVRVKID